jgi:hypothetical protein
MLGMSNLFGTKPSRTKSQLSTAIALVVALMLGACSGSDDAPDEPEVTTSAAPEPVPAALSATVVEEIRQGGASNRTFEATWTQDGSFRYDGANDGDDYSYDARTSTVRTYASPGAGAERVAIEDLGYEPRLVSYRQDVFNTDLVTWAQSVAETDPNAEELSFAGRDATRLVTGLPNNQIGSGPEEAEMIIDNETGVVLAQTLYRQGQRYSAVSVQGDVEEVERPSEVLIDFPDDVDVQENDGGFEAASLDSVQQSAGYAVSPPEGLPDGYVPASVWVRAGEGDPSGVEGLNPPSQDQVTIVFSNEWKQSIVNVRRTGNNPAVWDDPFGIEGVNFNPEEFTPESGLFEGDRAELITRDGVLPHAWAIDADFVVDVSGPLRADDLQAVVETMSVEQGD